MFGSGGGSGGNVGSNAAGNDVGVPGGNYVGTAGTAGGGIVIIFANTINITGSITANAVNPGGSGGGGAGGSIFLKANTLTLGANLATATNGGGNGGSGRIAVGAGTLSGTTNPTYTSISAP